jgi:hypothetical protein
MKMHKKYFSFIHILLLLICLIGSFQCRSDTANNPSIPESRIITLPILPNTPMPNYLQKPLRVYVRFNLINLKKINDQAENFSGTIDLTLRWQDSSLAFDPTIKGTVREEYSLTKATAKLDTIWQPNIVITNLDDKTSRVEPELFIYADGTVEYNQRVTGTFQTQFKLHAFPFDTESLSIKLSSPLYNKQQLEFTQDERDINHSGFSNDIKLFGWKLDKLTFASTTLRGGDGKFYPQFEAKVMVNRKAYSHLFVLVPLILIMLMPTLLTLYLKARLAKRLEAWAGAMLALVATSFTLNLRYPSLDSDSVISQLLTLCFIYQFLMMFLTISIFNPKLTKRVKNRLFVEETIQILRWVIPCGLFILVIVRIWLTALS